jgi:transcriptional regulator with XRE-family HTH domain
MSKPAHTNQPPRTWAGSTFRARVEHVRSSRGLSFADWSRRAGMDSNALSSMVFRSGDLLFSGAPDTLLRLAKAADVDYTWLATGDGYPEPDNRATAARIALNGGIPSDVVERVMAYRVQNEEHTTVLWWVQRFLLADQERRLAASAGKDETDPRKPPPWPRFG